MKKHIASKKLSLAVATIRDLQSTAGGVINRSFQYCPPTNMNCTQTSDCPR